MHDWWPDTWESKSRRQRHPPSPRRRTLRHRGLPSCDWRSTPGQPGGARKMAKRPKNPFTAVITRHWRRTESEAPKPARRPAQQGHRSPSQSTATAGFHSFLLCQTKHLSLNNNGCPSQSRTAPVRPQRPSAQLATVYLSLSRNQNIHHSVDELKLRHHEELDNGLLELELHGHRDVHDCTPQPCPVFIVRPGLAASCSSRARASLHPTVRAATTARA